MVHHMNIMFLYCWLCCHL